MRIPNAALAPSRPTTISTKASAASTRCTKWRAELLLQGLTALPKRRPSGLGPKDGEVLEGTQSRRWRCCSCWDISNEDTSRYCGE